MDRREIINKFFKSLETKNIDSLSECFTPEGTVHTPFTRSRNACAYFSYNLAYTTLFQIQVDAFFESREKPDQIVVTLTFTWEFKEFIIKDSPAVARFIFEPGSERIDDFFVFYDSANFVIRE